MRKLGRPPAVESSNAFTKRDFVRRAYDAQEKALLSGRHEMHEKVSSCSRWQSSFDSPFWANRAYAILRHELANVGVNNPGPKALDMVSLRNPDLDWVSLANGMGVEARRVDTIDELVLAFRAGVAVRGPFLIEVVL